MRDQVSDLIRSAGLPRIAVEIEALMRPSIRLRTRRAAEGELAVGASRIGGVPDLPAGVPWPECQGHPLAFVAQVNLREMAPFDLDHILPPRGMLFYFFDIDLFFERDVREGMSAAPNTWPWRALLQQDDLTQVQDVFRNEGALVPRRYSPTTVTMSPEITVPSFESLYLAQLGLDWNTMYASATATESARDEGERYMELARQVARLYDDYGEVSRLLGYPDQIQSYMETDCEMGWRGVRTGNSGGLTDGEWADINTSATRWRLLFQLDSVDDAGMMWGDVGRIYFWIPQEALEACDFSQVWMELQCC